MPSPWQDDANPVGYWTSQAPDWKRKVAGYATDPLRRVFFRPWFRLLARIGSKGVAEDFLDPVRYSGQAGNDLLGRNQENGSGRGAVSICQRAVLPFPWIADFFYRRHSGDAQIVIERESS